MEVDIRVVLESLVFALNSTLPKTRDMVTKRVILEDFIASLNRKGYIKNEDYVKYRELALALLTKT